MLNLVFLILISTFAVNAYAQNEIGTDPEANVSTRMDVWDPADINNSENGSYSKQNGEWCEISDDLKLVVKVTVNRSTPRFENKFFSKTKSGEWRKVEDPFYGLNSNITYDDQEIIYAAPECKKTDDCKLKRLVFKRCAPLLS